MKITEIKQQVKKPDRYSISVDNKYSFSLSSEELLAEGLFIGKQLTDQDISSLKKLSEKSLARTQCYHYLSYRQRSEWELVTFLKRKLYPESVIQATIDYLKDKGMVDDKKFCDSWIENRLQLKPTSIRQLKLELRQKHIESSIINEEIKKYNIDETDVIKQLIIKKKKQSKYSDNNKLLSYLARKGFSYSAIKQVLSNMGD
jgi:regulatory protein